MKYYPFVALALSVGSPALAERDAVPTGINSTGGQAFRDRCDAGEALVGLMARVDVYEITAVAGVCARPVSDAEVDQTSIRTLPTRHGTPDGDMRALRCSTPAPVVRSMYLNMRGGTVRVLCFPARKGPLLSGGPGVGASWGGAGDGLPIYLTVPSSCAEEEMAVGFHGRHDFRVFQLGLICDTAPGYNLPVTLSPGGVRKGPSSTGPATTVPKNPRPNRPRQ